MEHPNTGQNIQQRVHIWRNLFLLAPCFNYRVNSTKKIIGVRERKIMHRLIKNKKKIRIRREREREREITSKEIKSIPSQLQPSSAAFKPRN